jgi:phenylalanyl-tRNA synthetase beta subunit
MRAAVDLILELAGGELAGFVDVYPKPQQEKRVSVSVEQINSVLGTTLTPAEVADVFARLGLAYREEGGMFEVVVPFERLDLEIAEDLVEEVGRIVGYEHVPSAELPAFDKAPEVTETFASAEAAREQLVAQGYSEVFTSVFADKGERAVLNKVDSVRPFLRASLTPGLEAALEKNKQSKDLLGLTEIKLFEIGIVWKDGKEVLMLGMVNEKGGVQEKSLEPAPMPATLPLSAATRYEPFSRYPYIVRDVAMWIPAGTKEDEVLKLIKTEAGELAHKVWLFDRFEKGDKVSLAYRIIFQSFERTLTEEEVNKIMEIVSVTLKAKGFEIR